MDLWLQRDKENAIKDAPALDEALKKFKEWLTKLPPGDMRELSRTNLRRRVNIFVNSTPNVAVSEITREAIDAFLAKRSVSAKSKDNDRRAVSRFFAWCKEQKWVKSNPCQRDRKRKPEDERTPSILSLGECKAILQKAETFKRGRLAPYTAVCLFGGLRPFEAQRLTWKQVNLTDGEIRLEAWQTKTRRPRVVAMGDTLRSWLQGRKKKPFYPKNWRRDFELIKRAGGYGNPKRLSQEQNEKTPELKPWPVDVMRHTAISHRFRDTGSYGLTAEWAGNSEGIIKRH